MEELYELIIEPCDIKQNCSICENFKSCKRLFDEALEFLREEEVS